MPALLAGCQQSLPDNAALAAKIERHVELAQPGLRLDGYARFYAHEPNARVRAIYALADIVDRRPGDSVWTAHDKLPVIHDAGCGVVMIDYDAASDTLRSSQCGVGTADWCREEARAGRSPSPICDELLQQEN